MTDPHAPSDRLRPKTLWRSLDERAGSPLPDPGDTDLPSGSPDGRIDRRDLLRLIAASAGLAACDGARAASGAALLSQARTVPEATAGVPLVYATSLRLAGYGRGVLVRVQEGLPVKIDGNPLHPASLGATDVFAEAEILLLRDPERPRASLASGRPADPSAAADALAAFRTASATGNGAGTHVLLPRIASPTVDRLVAAAAAAMPALRWHRHDPVASDAAADGARLAFGRALAMVPDLSQADVVVVFGGDLFLGEPGHIRHAADFAARRRDRSRPPPQLVVAETTPGLAGAKADRRIPMAPAEIAAFALDLAAAVLSPESPRSGGLTAELASILRAAGPRGLVLAGQDQPAAVHALAQAINAETGAFGICLTAIEPVLQPVAEEESIGVLAAAMAAGEVRQLLVLGGNPAYDAPGDLGFADLLRQVPVSIALGERFDETARACDHFLPLRHPLESWGDLRAFDGTAGLCQPVARPPEGTFALEDVLAFLGGAEGGGRSAVETTWRDRLGGVADERWLRALEDGVVPDTAFPPVDPGPARLPPPEALIAAGLPPTRPIVVHFQADPSLHDGRYAVAGWNQELPKPFTKQVWGNAAHIAPATASALGLSSGEVVAIAVEGRTVEAPVWVLPGQAAGVVTLPLGSGRTAAGPIADGVGFDAYRVRPAGSPWWAGADLRPTGRSVRLVSTQEHHRLPGDDLIRTVADRDTTAEAAAGPPSASLYPEWAYEGHAWGMAIDLDACIGCNACVLSCQAENNVPVVGPDEVALGREMHWLRIDRYHTGEPDDPQFLFQPVLCMHCEKAPCEVVCPVNATVHSAEGLNDMVYNRCIGTRTCSNNCPYKVRRFNFRDYHAGEPGGPEMPFNPHVTVRQRGVMEKCTYCVQRIWAGRIAADLEGRPLADGEIRTACQDACPTRAIVFGDVNDPDAAVSRLKASPRNYALLGDLGTQPRTTYLARVAATGGPPADPE